MSADSKIVKWQKPVDKVFFLAAGAACVGTIVFALFLFYFYDGNNKLAMDLQSIEARIASQQKEVEHLDGLLKKYPQDIARFEKMLFKQKDIPLFMEGLSGLSRKFNVTILSLNRNEIAKPSGSDQDHARSFIQAASFQIALQGTMENLVRFLLELENNRQLLTIRQLQMTGGQYPQVGCSFMLDLYSLDLAPGEEEVK